MQFRNPQFQPITPRWSGTAREVGQLDIDMMTLPSSRYRAIYGVIHLLALENIFAEKNYQRPLHHRDRVDDVEPTKPRQCARYLVTQGKRKVLVFFAAIGIERENANPKPASLRQLLRLRMGHPLSRAMTIYGASTRARG